MLMYAEAKRRFHLLDCSREPLALIKDSWLAWPPVNERVRLFCLPKSTLKSEQMRTLQISETPPCTKVEHLKVLP
jgi:hypothetical protein